MSETSLNPESGAAAATETGLGLLDKVVSATKQTEPDRAQDLVRTLVEQTNAGTVTFDRNLTRTIERAIKLIDQKLSDQLNEIMHHERFLKLEGSWRGLHYLVRNSETGSNLKIRVVNASKRELHRGAAALTAAFFAPDRSAAGTIPLAWSAAACAPRSLIVGGTSPTEPIFYALPPHTIEAVYSGPINATTGHWASPTRR